MTLAEHAAALRAECERQWRAAHEGHCSWSMSHLDRNDQRVPCGYPRPAILSAPIPEDRLGKAMEMLREMGESMSVVLGWDYVQEPFEGWRWTVGLIGEGIITGGHDADAATAIFSAHATWKAAEGGAT